jgi:hypothetical protein
MNGQEKDDEIAQGIYTAQFWEYDSRLGRRWNTDPVVHPWESPYACFANNPVWFSDVNGDEATSEGDPPSGGGKTNPQFPLNKGGEGVGLDEVSIVDKKPGFWNRVGNWFKGVGQSIKDTYVSIATKGDNLIHKLGARFVIWGTGHSSGSGKKAPLPKDPIYIDMSDITDYLGGVKSNHDAQVTIPYKWPTKGDGQGDNKANENKVKLYEQPEDSPGNGPSDKPAIGVVTSDSIEMWHNAISKDGMRLLRIDTKQSGENNGEKGKEDHYHRKYGSVTNIVDLGPIPK